MKLATHQCNYYNNIIHQVSISASHTFKHASVVNTNSMYLKIFNMNSDKNRQTKLLYVATCKIHCTTEKLESRSAAKLFQK